MTEVEIAKRALVMKIIQKRRVFRDKTFPAQDLFVADTDKFIAAQCSRRAGKTNALALKFFKTLDTHPGSLCLYIALTRESARNIMWGVMQEFEDRFKLGLVFTESNLTITHPNTARLQMFGADMKNFIRRLKGIKTPGVAIDEAQDFGIHLETLVEDVLTPTLTDYEDSWLALTGTPGPVPLGYFYNVTEERKFGFSLHKWTLYDNPYLPKAREFVEELKRKREWQDDHPTLRREWFNNWVLDVESLLIKYDAAKNHYEEIPKGLHLLYILGVDIGMRDADALAVLAWSEHTHDIYLVEELITKGQDITQLTDQINYMMKRYDIQKIIMDEGALGKKIAEEIRRRKGVPVQPADKARKMENVAFLNDYLRLGRFKAKKDSMFAHDSQMVQIDWEKTTPDRLIVKDSFHSDIIDAVLYAFKESPAFTYEKAIEKPKPETKEFDDDFELQMQEHLVTKLREAKELKDGVGMNWHADPSGVPSWHRWDE